MTSRLKLLLLAAALATLPVAALAQNYPERPVRFIAGFPPGSSIDVVSRIVLDDIRERTGTVFVVERILSDINIVHG